MRHPHVSMREQLKASDDLLTYISPILPSWWEGSYHSQFTLQLCSNNNNFIIGNYRPQNVTRGRTKKKLPLWMDSDKSQPTESLQHKVLIERVKLPFSITFAQMMGRIIHFLLYKIWKRNSLTSNGFPPPFISNPVHRRLKCFATTSKCCMIFMLV